MASTRMPPPSPHVPPLASYSNYFPACLSSPFWAPIPLQVQDSLWVSCGWTSQHSLPLLCPAHLLVEGCSTTLWSSSLVRFICKACWGCTLSCHTAQYWGYYEFLSPAQSPGEHCQGLDFATDHSPFSPAFSVPLPCPLVFQLLFASVFQLWCDVRQLKSAASAALSSFTSQSSSQKPLGFIRCDFPCYCSSGTWTSPSQEQDFSQLPHPQSAFPCF